jgi:hypothetical protein
MASPFDKQYMMLFNTTEVTQQQIDYLVLVDKYRNNMVADNQIKMLPDNGKFDLKKLAEDVRIQEGAYLREGAAAAEKLGLQRAGEVGVARYLRDVKTLYPDITEYHRFNMRMEELAAQVKAAPASTHKPMDIHTFGPAIAAQGFFTGAEAGAEVGNFVFKIKQGLKPLGLQKGQEDEYVKIATSAAGEGLAVRKLAEGRMYVPDLQRYFQPASKAYDNWATANNLSDAQREAFNPVTPAIERAIRERDALKATHQKESDAGFGFSW